MRLVPLSVAIIALAVVNAHASDTAAAISALRSAPITAFDLGIYSLEQTLHDKLLVEGVEIEVPERQIRQYQAGAGYNPSTGVLTVYAIGINFPAVPDNWQFRSECEQILTHLRLLLGYNPRAGELYKKPSVIMDFFLDNFRGRLSGDIAEVTALKFHREVGGRMRECSGELMSRDVDVFD